jgi:hypothetical protein
MYSAQFKSKITSTRKENLCDIIKQISNKKKSRRQSVNFGNVSVEKISLKVSWESIGEWGVTYCF